MRNSDTDFWQSHLALNEKVLFEFGYGQKFINFMMIMWVLVSLITMPIYIGFLILPITLFYCLYYVKKAYKYVLTDKRILAKTGLFSTSMISIDYSKITDIFVKQNFSEKIFAKTGEVHINTAGSYGKELVLKYVEEPYGIKNRIIEYSSKAQGFSENIDYTDELEKLSGLKNKGVITNEEFERKKARILGI